MTLSFLHFNLHHPSSRLKSQCCHFHLSTVSYTRIYNGFWPPFFLEHFARTGKVWLLAYLPPKPECLVLTYVFLFVFVYLCLCVFIGNIVLLNMQIRFAVKCLCHQHEAVVLTCEFVFVFFHLCICVCNFLFVFVCFYRQHYILRDAN